MSVATWGLLQCSAVKRDETSPECFPPEVGVFSPKANISSQPLQIKQLVDDLVGRISKYIGKTADFQATWKESDSAFLPLLLLP